ncbi:MAG: RNA polymerase factor sigma-54 [Abditibacteriales bacterium]|nr:RNA polymerase factor sigma-54 [Abditibacteriales bacterium]MDW8364401.1 RNA polymerase factor sigma-54 [Abditibacteriales bacterium]
MLLQQVQEQKLVQRPDVRLLMTNTILQMTALELVQRIEQELQENPALELADEAVCPACQAVMMGDDCANCGYRADREPPLNEWGLPREYLSALPSSQASDDEIEDPTMNIATPFTLHEHLRWQAQMELSGEQWEVADYLIGCINDDGYLEGDLGDIAARLGVDVQQVASVLRTIQTFEPVGVGASNLRESLLIQLNDLREQGVRCDLAERIIRDHLDDLARRCYQRIASRLAVPLEAVIEAADFIVRNLTPYPGRLFRPPWNVKGVERNLPAKPEVIITRHGNQYEVEVLQLKDALLRVNQFYRHLYREMQRNRNRYSETERHHVTQCVKRAELFIENLKRRNATLTLIVEALIECQRDFFDHDGDRAYLKPLTKKHLAALVGRDVSTVSRATSNKFVQIPPYGQVVSFDIFFEAAPDAKDLLRQLIAQEDPLHPLSDQEIAKRLQSAGFAVARRTVAKYRRLLKIPPTFSRRAVQ